MECEKCKGNKSVTDKEGNLIACECEPNFFNHGVNLNDIECNMTDIV